MIFEDNKKPHELKNRLEIVFRKKKKRWIKLHPLMSDKS